MPLMSSENTHDLQALADCFAADATVRDEGQTMKGLKAIVSTKLTGDFPGSPITLDFVFTLKGGKIAALETQS
jgi:hypothetical protein